MAFRAKRTGHTARHINQHQRAEIVRLQAEYTAAEMRLWGYVEDLREQGFSVPEVASVLGIHSSTVYRHLPRQGQLLDGT